MLATAFSRAQFGMYAPRVTIDVHVTAGLPTLSVVGLPELAVKESCTVGSVRGEAHLLGHGKLTRARSRKRPIQPKQASDRFFGNFAWVAMLCCASAQVGSCRGKTVNRVARYANARHARAAVSSSKFG
jgi:hypothetical protein